MASPDTLDTVRRYFQNADELYGDWYGGFYSSELFPGEPVATVPSIESIQGAFDSWFEDKRKQLYNLVCIEWDYPRRVRARAFRDRVELAAALADLFVTCTWHIPSPVATAVLLVRAGLDRLCKR